MFALKTTELSPLEKEIDSILARMNDIAPDDPKYATMADQLVKLYKLKEVDSKRKLSPDALAAVVGNLVGILVIVGYEHKNVITSKALSFVMKSR
jgi:hypothetical protein